MKNHENIIFSIILFVNSNDLMWSQMYLFVRNDHWILITGIIFVLHNVHTHISYCEYNEAVVAYGKLSVIKYGVCQM